MTTGAWDSASSMTVTANSEPLVLDRTTTDWAGTLRRSYRIPHEFPTGRHTATFTGVRKGEPFTLSVVLLVAPRPRFTG